VPLAALLGVSTAFEDFEVLYELKLEVALKEADYFLRIFYTL